MKTKLFLIFALLLLAGSVSAQNNKASVSLTAAIYEEEVTGNLDKALSLYLDILKKYPSDRQVAAKTLYHLGLVSEKMGQQKADEYFQQLVSKYPDQTEMATLARAKLALYKNANSESTKKAEQSFKLAAELFKQLKYEEAVTEYEKVIKLAPESQMAQEAQLWIGHCYFKEGKNELALKSFNTILKEFPGSNLVPVVELMAGQVKQTMGREPSKNSVVVLDEKTILDTVTGVKYTKINTWTGKNDVIKSSNSITDVAPNRKFLLADNKIIPFDNSDPFIPFDTLTSGGIMRLSPDGTKIAKFGLNGISVMPVSPENGLPHGPVHAYSDKPYGYGNDLNWSPDGNKLIFSLFGEGDKCSLWTLNTNDALLKQVTISSPFGFWYPVFSKDGANILYKCGPGVGTHLLKMKPANGGKSLTIASNLLKFRDRFILSPDNQWTMLKNNDDSKSLFRLADQQQQQLSTPEEVGDFVSWTDNEHKVFFYRSSYEESNTSKVASIFGGPAYGLAKEFETNTFGWTPDSKGIFAFEKSENGNQYLKVISLTSQIAKKIDGIEIPGKWPSFSPDYSKVLVESKSSGSNDLMILPISLKECKVIGKPILLFKGFNGYMGICSWSPDGKKITVNHNGKLWICDTDGGIPIQLKGIPEFVQQPGWSPDGNTLAVFLHSSKQLLILNVSDGKVIHTYDKVDNFAWASEGNEVTVAFLDGQLNAISLTSGKIRKIINWKETTPFTGLNDMAWSPDGKWLAINGYNERIISNMRTFLINNANGKLTELAENEDESKESIFWSPDSKWILYFSFGLQKSRIEGALWEADLTDFMKKLKPGTEKGYTTDFDFKTIDIPAGGVAPDGTFTDSRDGHVYKYKKIGTQTWMTENLAYLPEVNPDSATSLVDKRYYVYGYGGLDVKEAKNAENYQKYGVLYNWPAAMNGNSSSNSVPSGVQGICQKVGIYPAMQSG